MIYCADGADRPISQAFTETRVIDNFLRYYHHLTFKNVSLKNKLKSVTNYIRRKVDFY